MFRSLEFSPFSWRLGGPNLSWMCRNCRLTNRGRLRIVMVLRWTKTATRGVRVHRSWRMRPEHWTSRSKDESEDLEEEEAEKRFSYTRT